MTIRQQLDGIDAAYRRGLTTAQEALGAIDELVASEGERFERADNYRMVTLIETIERG